METISNPMMDNLRVGLDNLKKEKVLFKKLQLTYCGDSIEITVLSLIPKSFRVDKDGIYIIPFV